VPPNKRLKLTGHRALQISVLPSGHEIKRFQLSGHLGRQLSREPLGGYLALERLVTTTYLEMTSAPQATPFRDERKLELRRAEIPSPELNRFFYVAVGSDWWWYSRLNWNRERWLAYVDRPELETWVGYLSGTPAGYFELESQARGQVELAYFGLLPSFIGRGLGTELLSAAIDRAWQLQPRRVWVHTCTLDHPRALQTYQSQGFEIYRSEEKIEDLPDTPLDLWPVASSGAD
jgi:GNAT superfamily N-acetyltransferase